MVKSRPNPNNSYVSHITGVTSTQEEISMWMSQHLDFTGHSMDMVEKRRSRYRDISSELTSLSSSEVCVVGSTCDGITRTFQSDVDVLEYIQHSICKTEPHCSQAVPWGANVF